MSESIDLLSFFKTLADANRLRIVGLLATRPHTVEELAEILDLRPSTASHHLARLRKTGLVAAAVEGHYRVHTLDTGALERLAQTLLSNDRLKALSQPAADSSDPYDKKVLQTFLDADGRLKAHPMKRRKFQVILRYAAERFFKDDGPWPESEINRRLKEFTDDPASIRRGFIDYRMMTRTTGGSSYSKLPPADATGV